VGRGARRLVASCDSLAELHPQEACWRCISFFFHPSHVCLESGAEEGEGEIKQSRLASEFGRRELGAEQKALTCLDQAKQYCIAVTRSYYYYYRKL